MSQKSLLLNFRELAERVSQPLDNEAIQYDWKSGLWKEDGKPVISRIMENEEAGRGLATTITKTQEAIDQIEGSYGGHFATLITETREAVDQSERS